MAAQRANRMKAELENLLKSPPPGIICKPGDKIDIIMADITGPPGSPFERGVFTVEVSMSERYPFTPPNAKFITPIYHPNVDNTGRICLSGLKPKPAGSWNCSMNIATILSAIRLLMSEPNLGDPLMADIAMEYKDNFSRFREKAKAKTLQYATKDAKSSAIPSDSDDEDSFSALPKTPEKQLSAIPKTPERSPSVMFQSPEKSPILIKRNTSQVSQTAKKLLLTTGVENSKAIPKNIKGTTVKSNDSSSKHHTVSTNKSKVLKKSSQDASLTIKESTSKYFNASKASDTRKNPSKVNVIEEIELSSDSDDDLLLNYNPKKKLKSSGQCKRSVS